MATESFKEAKLFKSLMGELCPKVIFVYVHCDSQSALHLAKIRLHFIKEPNILISSITSFVIKLKRRV